MSRFDDIKDEHEEQQAAKEMPPALQRLVERVKAEREAYMQAHGSLPRFVYVKPSSLKALRRFANVPEDSQPELFGMAVVAFDTALCA